MYTHIYIFPFSSSFHPPTVITWFLSMKMGIVVERKEKGIRRRVKGKKEETDRSSIQIARGIFFKALSADPLCAATALSWIGIIIITVKGANETIMGISSVHAINSMHLEPYATRSKHDAALANLYCSWRSIV